jgi:DNA-binding IclR family transcriptional regulator
MTSQRRMLSILDLYVPPGRPALTAEQIMTTLAFSRGTAYRYIKELVDAGLLSRIGAAYTLGPRIIELDYYIRQFDPLLHASRVPLENIRDKFECDVLLASYFSDRLVVIHHLKGSEDLRVSYGRGHAMPLFRGAGGKVIVATLPARWQKKLYDGHQAEIGASGGPASWEQFRDGLAQVRKAGYAVSVGELDRGNVGVATAIVHEAPTPPSCVCLVFGEKRHAILDKALLAQDVAAMASQIQHNLRRAG